MARRLSVNAELADRAAAHAIDLLRFDATARREVLGYLRRLEEKLVDDVARFRIGGVADQSIRRQRAEHLLVQVQESIRTAYGQAADASAQMLLDLGKIESRAALAGAAQFAVAADIQLNILTAGQLRRIVDSTLIERAPSRAWWERQAGDLMQRFSDEIREGVGLAETNDDLVRRIRGRATGKRHLYELNGREHTFVEFKGGLMDTSTRNARALVRTSVQTIAGQVRRDTFEENQDVVKGVVQISTLDLRTTVECFARGGLAWSLPDYSPIDHEIAYNGGVPLHWGCRSTEAPLLRSWEELGIDRKEVAGDEGRWSRMDGEVPADFSMDDFLGRRSPDQIDDVLGAGIGSLYREGRVGLQDLIDAQSGRALSLRELEGRLGIVN